MRLIDQAELHDLHAAALAANLATSRAALLSGIDRRFVEGLRTASTPSEQLLLDLDALSCAGALTDGTVPLRAWLDNAIQLAVLRAQVTVFQRTRDRLSPTGPTPRAPAPVEPHPGSVQTDPLVSIARLPGTGRDLFGREKELAWLDTCWQGSVRVVSIVAWGGVGKSALVNAWLRGLSGEGWRGAARVFGWSFYSQGTDRQTSSDEFVDVALRWFGDPDPTQGSAWEKGERLANLVRRERALLVLDGLEPLQWGPGPGVGEGRLRDQAMEALLKELAAQNKGMCVVTTRIRLADLDALGGEKVCPLDLDHLVPEAGAELLRARGATGLVEELRAASEEYGGHSLSLTLLGNYLRKAHKGDVRARRRIPLDGQPAAGMMATYERWFRDRPELPILGLLGFFDRPAPVDEIAALLADPPIAGLTDALAGLGKSGWNEAVTTLQDVGLLARSGEAEERLDAHPLVRQHFGRQVRREQPEAWREGHRRLYEHLRKKAKDLPDTVEEMAPLHAAVVHGCMAGRSQEALVEVYWKRIRRGNEGFNTKKLGAFGSAAAVLSAFFEPPWERLAPGLGEAWQGRVLSDAGLALRGLGRLPEAKDLMRLALQQAVAQENWKHAASNASTLCELLQTCGELRDAEAAGRQSVEHADRSGDAFERMARRTTLAAALHALGRLDEAAALFEEAERVQEELQPAHPLLYGLPGFRYCNLLLDQGREADVLPRAAQALTNVPSRSSLLVIALNHLSLGRAHHTDQAATDLQRAVDGLRCADARDYLPLGLLARAAHHTSTGAHPAARHDLDEALALSTRVGARLHETDAHLGLARLALAQRPTADPTAARAHLAAARALIAATAYHRRDADLRALEAEVAAHATRVWTTL